MSIRILITGGAGFVGSSIAIFLKEKYPSYSVTVFDNLKRRGSELNLPRLKEKSIDFIHGDIRCKSDFDSLGGDFNFILEASAEPSVLAGLSGSSDYLIDTNLAGTINCLNFARQSRAAFLFLSTSRVYPIKPLEATNYIEQDTRFSFLDKQVLSGVSSEGINEKFVLEGYRSLYGATKLASELLIQEFNHFYNVKTVINRCGVLTGPWQMGKVDQGVVVLWMAKHFWKQKLGYFGYGGEGKQVRDILHVYDLFRLIDLQMHDISKYNGETFNVGGGVKTSLSLQELTTICQEISGNKIHIEKVKENRQADIRIYVTDNKKISDLSGWQPEITNKQILSETFNWIRDNQKLLKGILA